MEEGTPRKEEVKGAKMQKYDITELLKMGLMAFLFLMLVIGIWGLYSSLNQIISIWFNYKYAAIYRVILNIGVVIVVFYFFMRLIESYKKGET